MKNLPCRLIMLLPRMRRRQTPSGASAGGISMAGFAISRYHTGEVDKFFRTDGEVRRRDRIHEGNMVL